MTNGQKTFILSHTLGGTSRIVHEEVSCRLESVRIEDLIMKKRTFFSICFIGGLAAVIGVFMLRMSSLAASPDKSLYDGKSDVYLFGSMDPEGHKHIWALTAETAAGITWRLAAKYPSQSIDGVIFYRVRSWRDMANLALESHKQQGLMIVDLIKEVERLKTSSLNRQLESKVIKLEKKVNEMVPRPYAR